MHNNLTFTLSAFSILLFASCSKLGPLSSNNFTVTPTPLEVQGGQVSATIDGLFPEKYMKKKAIVTVTPELRYGNGLTKRGESATFQGEKVLGNNQTISYLTGGHYNMKSTFAYEPAMQKSDMYLTFNAKIGNRQMTVPAVKVSYGIITTSELYKQTLSNAGGCLALDSFQRTTAQKQEANIRFLVNQANLRKSELKNNSVQEFVQLLQKINADRERLNIQNVEVQAYASPEGGFSFNDKLANKRQGVSEGYVKQQLKQTNVATNVDAHYTAQDWDGFQKLVQASNIQDKDVILRVLSMYKDPQEREAQIRNMSQAFRELADGILPELRRSRLIINYQTVGRSDDQIKQAYVETPTKLTVNEMLYAASLESSPAKKKEIYTRAAEYYDKDYRAFNNLAVMALNSGDDASAKNFISRALRLDPKASEPQANLALIALKQGQLADAENYLAKAIDANSFGEVLGNLNIAKGNYAAAVENFGNSTSNSAALAQLLNKNYDSAKAILKQVKNPDGLTSYLHAIISARQGNAYAAQSYLDEAVKKDSSLKQYADNDLEFASIRK